MWFTSTNNISNAIILFNKFKYFCIFSLMLFVYNKMYKYMRGKYFKFQVNVKCKCFHLKTKYFKKDRPSGIPGEYVCLMKVGPTEMALCYFNK